MSKLVWLVVSVLVTANSWGLCDPTRPKPGFESISAGVSSNTKPANLGSSSALKLQSVLKQGSSYSAVINGKVVRKGESLDGYQVAKIAASKVVLEGNGRKVVLSLFQAKNQLKIESNE